MSKISNPHLRTIQLINSFGFKPKKVAEILETSTQVIYNTMKLYERSKFTENDFLKLRKYLKETFYYFNLN